MTDALRPLVPVPFAEAIAWAKARKVVLPEVYYGELQGLARSMAFSIAGLAKLDQLQAVLDSLAANLESGESFGKWQKRVRDGEIHLDLPPHRLETIFRTNIQGHYGRGRCEQQKRTTDSHPWYMLDAVNDSRTRPAHAAMDGKVARHDDPWWDKNTPPNGYQCFLPDSDVSGDLFMGFKYWYEGPVIRLKTRDGRCVTVTANHPILTPDGWVGAQELNDGDHVFRHVGKIEPLVLPAKGKNHGPAKAEDVFNALASQGRIFGGHVSDLDFYGDGVFGKGQVEIVGAKGMLRDAVNPQRAKSIASRSFVRANLERIARNALRFLDALGKRLRHPLVPSAHDVRLAAALPSQSDALSFGADGDAVTQENVFDAAARYLVFLRKFVKRRSGRILGCGDVNRDLAGQSMLENLSIRSRSQDPARSKPPLDGFVIMPPLPGDLRARLPGDVFTDDVVKVERFDYCGHVYDFESANGLILTDGIISSNCRCRRISLTEAQAPRFIEADRKRIEKDPKLAEARAQAEPDKGWDYSPCADPTAGLKRAIEQRRMRCGDGRLAQGRDSPCHERIVSILREMADTATDPAPQLAIRSSWPDGFPAVAIHATESSVKKHPEYAAAKSGDPAASLALVMAVAEDRLVLRLDSYRDKSPLILPVQGMEGVSLNTIPLALGVIMAKRLGYDLATSVVQTTKAGHTGATGWWRLRSPALFSGDVERGRNYLLVDDFVGMGGTYANLRGYIEAKGGVVLGAHALTGKPRSAILSLQSQTLQSLRAKHGTLEPWWRAEFGYGFDALTESEATYLLRAEDADTIRRRLAEAASEGEY